MRVEWDENRCAVSALCAGRRRLVPDAGDHRRGLAG